MGVSVLDMAIGIAGILGGRENLNSLTNQHKIDRFESKLKGIYSIQDTNNLIDLNICDVLKTKVDYHWESSDISCIYVYVHKKGLFYMVYIDDHNVDVRNISKNRAVEDIGYDKIKHLLKDVNII